MAVIMYPETNAVLPVVSGEPESLARALALSGRGSKKSEWHRRVFHDEAAALTGQNNRGNDSVALRRQEMDATLPTHFQRGMPTPFTRLCGTDVL